MNITIPFTYTAEIIKPRCRKPVFTSVSDSIEIKLSDILPDNFPAAVRLCGVEHRWNGKGLYIEREITGKTINMFNKDSQATAKEDIAQRMWLSDDKDVVIENIRDFYSKFIASGDVTYLLVPEAFFSCTTFGMGDNHGHTNLFLEHNANSFDSDSIFNLNQLELAKKYACSVATNRGDTEGLESINSKFFDLEVLIPESISLPNNPWQDESADLSSAYFDANYKSLNKCKCGSSTFHKKRNVLAVDLSFPDHSVRYDRSVVLGGKCANCKKELILSIPFHSGTSKGIKHLKSLAQETLGTKIKWSQVKTNFAMS